MELVFVKRTLSENELEEKRRKFGFQISYDFLLGGDCGDREVGCEISKSFTGKCHIHLEAP